MSEDIDELAVLTLSDHSAVRTPHKDRASLEYNLRGPRESRLLFALNPQLCDVSGWFRLFTTTCYKHGSEEERQKLTHEKGERLLPYYNRLS